MLTIPWSPPGLSPQLAAVSVPPGNLTEAAWWAALSDRVSALVAKAPNPEGAASLAAQALGTPEPENPLAAGEFLVQHNLELRTALDLQVHAEKSPFPARVVVASPAAKQALDETDLATWLDLAASAVSASSLD